MKLWLKCVVVLFLITMAGYISDRLLRHEGVPRHDLLLLSDFLIGGLAAVLVFALGRQSEQRSKLVSARLKVIAEMNHHTRNALQVIAYHSTLGKDEKEITVIRQAVDRITWALQEVLPQIPDFKDVPMQMEKNSHPGRSSAGNPRKTG